MLFHVKRLNLALLLAFACATPRSLGELVANPADAPPADLLRAVDDAWGACLADRQVEGDAAELLHLATLDADYAGRFETAADVAGSAAWPAAAARLVALYERECRR